MCISAVHVSIVPRFDLDRSGATSPCNSSSAPHWSHGRYAGGLNKLNEAERSGAEFPGVDEGVSPFLIWPNRGLYGDWDPLKPALVLSKINGSQAFPTLPARPIGRGHFVHFQDACFSIGNASLNNWGNPIFWDHLLAFSGWIGAFFGSGPHWPSFKREVYNLEIDTWSYQILHRAINSQTLGNSESQGVDGNELTNPTSASSSNPGNWSMLVM